MITAMQEKTAVALGCFDGLHTGHISVIKNALSFKRDGLLPCVLVFDEHPQAVLSGSAPLLLQTAEDKLNELRELGAIPVSIPFSEIRELCPEEFFSKVLIERLNVGAVCCGYNFRFGRGGQGTSQTLAELCKKNGISCTVSGEIIFDGAPVSSTRIRRCIEAGEIESANKMLGKPFSYCIEVIEGDKIGRTLGSPTINQHFPMGFIIPKFGVYASRALVDGVWLPSMTNVGVRPTITGKDLRSETHIFDFDGDLYGKEIRVVLLRYIRDERRFSSLGELKEQITKDRISAGQSQP